MSGVEDEEDSKLFGDIIIRQKAKPIFCWLLNHHCYCSQNERKQHSPMFEYEGYNFKFSLETIPYMLQSGHHLNAYLHVKKVNENSNIKNLKVKMGFLDKDYKIIDSSVVDYKESEKHFKFTYFTKVAFTKHDDCLLFVNNPLIIFCTFGTGKMTASTINKQLKFFEDVSEMYGDDKFCDGEIVVNDKKFRIHKAIVCARSRVFDAAFRSNMKESNDGSYEIKDFQPEVVEELIRFIYTCTINRKELAIDIFKIAKLYEVKDLVDECLLLIKDSLSCENYVEIMYLASTYDLLDLKKDVLCFIIKNSQVLLEF